MQGWRGLDNPWMEGGEENETYTYINLLNNPERYTGYKVGMDCMSCMGCMGHCGTTVSCCARVETRSSCRATSFQVMCVTSLTCQLYLVPPFSTVCNAVPCVGRAGMADLARDLWSELSG